jgi:DNA-binding LacI/PurR family transcriptional regulator
VATIDDVARRAGVSTSTVSYVLSGKRSISAATQQRVRRAIDELGYSPHAGARALASSRTDVIGLAAPLRVGVDVDVDVVMQFVAGVAAGARALGYDILLLVQDDQANLARITGGSMVDALAVMDIEADDPRLPAMTSMRQPVVLLGLPREPHGLSCVDLDFEQVGATAAGHLLRLGHRSIALIGSAPEVMERRSSYAERMLRGFTRACAAAGARHLVLPTRPSVTGARDSVDRLLAQVPDVTGVVVHNEFALAHVVARLEDAGRRIPQDLSLVAVCPESTAASLSMPVTSIDLPAERIGRIAVEMLATLLAGDAPQQVRLLPPVLTERGSTAAPATA